MRLWWSLRKRMARLDRRPRVVERLGARWELDPSDWLDLRLLAGQPFEAEQRTRFAQMTARRRPSRFYDIGANFGLYSVTLGRAHPELAIEAFEPVSRTRAKLARNLGLNGLETRVQVHALALSDAAGEAEIAIDPRSSGLSTLSASDAEAARRAFSTAETIRTARLDDLSTATGETLAIKIDVEGHEAAALAGMVRVLAENRGGMMIETRARNAPEVRARLAAAGWRETGAVQEEIFFEKD
ncbi:FkbM family methyltransferase [Albimonas pacifica]|uniref:Methyltransferase, FkbM family n=1 Tax=Albimonas pacifica TaxID=1114924 RepID=A0A1I3NWK9_9RHOB|nr:FkbM family methyltransferase [Albimonas pacifica]SFJ13166.1 methyltransferase, FkbM family [Albimonas pacifica]